MNDDFERAMVMYQALAAGGPREEMTYLVVPGAPANKVRPRFTRAGHAYAPKEQREAEAHTQSFFAKAFPEPMTGNVSMGCIFYRPNKQRIDTDNMLKHVCDSANGVAWIDDMQVTAIMGVTELDSENPRTVIVVGRHVSSLTRGSDAVRACPVCGKDFQINPAMPKKIHCSRKCASVGKGYTPLDDPVPCANCGKPFVRQSSYRKVCSVECRTEAIRGSNKRRSVPLSCCADCGKELTHHRGGRCRDCWKASFKKGDG